MKNIIIPNPGLLKEKLFKIKKEGKEDFHVISDFDKTLTPAFIDGKEAETGVGQIRAGGYLCEDYVREAYALKDKYYPIEIDESIPLEERSKKMLEWWQNHLKIMIKYGLNKGVIKDIITKGKIVPRKGTFEFYDLLNNNNIPMIIFSAGKGDLIEGFLKHEKKFYKNIHIIANFYKYDKKGLVIGYKSGIIHSFNKNESQIKNTPIYNQVKSRKNVLLLGDGIGDLGMLEGLEHETVIKVGFLNKDIDKKKNLFEENFDIILLNDSPMDCVNNLLKELF